MYFPQNWEFGSALAKLRNFVRGGSLNPHSVRYCTNAKPVQTRAVQTKHCRTGRELEGKKQKTLEVHT
jgi:hypothetical protein